MNKNKKNIILLGIVILVLVGLFTLIYSFNEAKKLARSQSASNKLQAELDSAKNRLLAENERLAELRRQSFFFKISEEEYAKTKKLVDSTNIFFTNADSDNPEINVPTKNQTIEDEINARRAKINEILRIWADNNAHSRETDKKLIEEIKIYLLMIQAYLAQLQSIVSSLSAGGSSGLTTAQISNYATIVETGTNTLNTIIKKIDETARIINTGTGGGSSGTGAVDNQIGIIADIERQIQDLEDKIKDNQATTTATSSLPVIGPVSTSTVSVSTTTNNTASTSTARRRSVNVNNSSIIYTPNPAPYRDNGVDVNYSSQNSPLQDW